MKAHPQRRGNFNHFNIYTISSNGQFQEDRLTELMRWICFGNKGRKGRKRDIPDHAITYIPKFALVARDYIFQSVGKRSPVLLSHLQRGHQGPFQEEQYLLLLLCNNNSTSTGYTTPTLQHWSAEASLIPSHQHIQQHFDFSLMSKNYSSFLILALPLPRYLHY
jgi:hypothetical protein